VNKSLLRTCKACGNEISRHSPFCRNCGHPQAAPLIVWLLIVFLLLTMAFYLAFTIYGMSHIGELRQPESSRTPPAAPTACLAVHTTGPSPLTDRATCPRRRVAVTERKHCRYS